MANDKGEEETYSLIFSSLKHPIRRRILRMLEHRDLTFSEILEALSIDSGHLSYHLENLGELVTHTQDGKYSLSSFGTAAIKLMGGVEGNDAPTTLSRSKAGTIVKFLSLALALTLLFVSLYSMNIVTSVQSNEAGWSNMSLALAQDQTFNYTLNLTQKEGPMISDASASGILLADPEFAGSINEWVEYYPRLEIEINQTYSLEFNHTYLNITLHDSKGNVVSSAIWGVDSEIGSSSGWIGAVINHPDNYRLELNNLGPDWFYANIGVYISGQYLQKPLFYYGLAGLIMTSSYLVVFFVVGVWTKKRERTPLQSLECCLVKKSRCVLCDMHALCAIRAVQL